MKKVFGLVAIFALSLFAANAQSFYNVELKMQEGKFAEALPDLLQLIDKEKAKGEKMKPSKLAEYYKLAADCRVQAFNPELMKAAQQLPFDTVLFNASLDETIEYSTLSHQYDTTPDKNGKVKSKFLKENKRMISMLLDYYNYAAQFALAGGKHAVSIEYFQKYYELPKNPVFSKEETDSIYASKQEIYSAIPFNLVMINYQQKDWDGVLNCVDKALADTLNLNDLYIIKSQAYMEKKDTASWVGVMKEAIGRLESPAGFLQQLLYHYVDKDNLAEANAMAEDLVAKNPNNKSAWYMKGCVALNMEKNFESARASFEKALSFDPDYADANYNMGVTYINQVIAMRDKGEFCLDRSKPDQFNADRARIQEFYRQALPYFEKVQQIIPDQPRKWAPTLQQIYYNLDNKAKADEMDELLRNANN